MKRVEHAVSAWPERVARGLRRAAIGTAHALVAAMTKRFPVHPAHPERVCWGCERLCPASHMVCGNGKERTEHPSELFGDDWYAEPVLPLHKPDDAPAHDRRASDPPQP